MRFWVSANGDHVVNLTHVRIACVVEGKFTLFIGEPVVSNGSAFTLTLKDEDRESFLRAVQDVSLTPLNSSRSMS